MRPSSLVVIVALSACVALAACGGSSAPGTPAGGPPVATPDASAGPTPFQQKAYACCATAAANSVVGQYLGVQRALSRDDVAGAVSAAATLAATCSQLAGAASPEDAATLQKLAADAQALTGADIAAVRKGFGTLSTDLIAWGAVAAPNVAATGSAGGLRIAKAYCPMADASWLQTEPTVSNPYYGASMLTCGSFQ